MVENINEFLSLASLVIFIAVFIIIQLNRLNKGKIEKHMEEEYYYYQENEESDY